MGYLIIIISCFVIYYGFKVWNEYKSGKSSGRPSSSTDLKTRNEINRYKEMQKIKYERRE